MKGKSLSRVRLFATSWTAAYQAPPSMGFSRQEYWSGVPSPSPLLTIVTIISLFSWEALRPLYFSLQLDIHFLYGIPCCEYITVNHSTMGRQCVFSVSIIVIMLIHALWCTCTRISLIHTALVVEQLAHGVHESSTLGDNVKLFSPSDCTSLHSNQQ